MAISWSFTPGHLIVFHHAPWLTSNVHIHEIHPLLFLTKYNPEYFINRTYIIKVSIMLETGSCVIASFYDSNCWSYFNCNLSDRQRTIKKEFKRLYCFLIHEATRRRVNPLWFFNYIWEFHQHHKVYQHWVSSYFSCPHWLTSYFHPISEAQTQAWNRVSLCWFFLKSNNYISSIFQKEYPLKPYYETSSLKV